MKQNFKISKVQNFQNSKFSKISKFKIFKISWIHEVMNSWIHEIMKWEFMKSWKNHENSVLLYTERYGGLVTIDPHDNESKQRTNEWMHACSTLMHVHEAVSSWIHKFWWSTMSLEWILHEHLAHIQCLLKFLILICSESLVVSLRHFIKVPFVRLFECLLQLCLP